MVLFFFASPPKLSGQAKKEPKGDPKTITSRFREAALIKLLYYCSFNISSLTTNTTNWIKLIL